MVEKVVEWSRASLTRCRQWRAAYNDNDATQHKSHTASVCTDGSSHTIEAHLVVEVEAQGPVVSTLSTI